MELVKKLPDTQCTSDPLPTWLLKQSVEVLAPFLCRLFNWSLQSGTVPSTIKFAYITPLLKKADLNPADAMASRIDQFPICPSSRSCWNDWLASSF